MSITWDTIEGAQASTDKLAFTGVRTGIITGIDTTLPSGQILSRALGDLPPYGEPYPDPNYAFAVVTHRAVERLGGSNSKLRATVRYATPTGKNPAGSSFILTRGRSLELTDTELHPKDKKPLRVTWVHPQNPAQIVGPSIVAMRYLQPHKTITATGYYHGTPPAGLDDAFGRVNDAAWQGRPAGYWMFMGGDDTTEDFGNNYAIRLEFATKWTEDWSSWATLRDPSTGLTLPVQASLVAGMKAIAYQYAIDEERGITRAGLYDTANFSSIFGF